MLFMACSYVQLLRLLLLLILGRDQLGQGIRRSHGCGIWLPQQQWWLKDCGRDYLCVVKLMKKKKKKKSLAFELSNQSMKRISKGVYGSFKQDFPNLGYMLRIHISYLR